MGLDAGALVGLIYQIGVHDDRHRWSTRALRWEDRHDLAEVIDTEHARGRTGWVMWRDDRVPVLAVVEDRLHWSGMSVPIDADPFLAVAQALAAVDAGRRTSTDSRRA